MLPNFWHTQHLTITLPTTISTLQKVVVYNGMVKLAERNIIVQDQVAFDNAVDLDIVLLDKHLRFVIMIYEFKFRCTSFTFLRVTS